MNHPLSPEDRRWLDSAARYAAPYKGTTGQRPLAAALVVNEIDGLVVGRAVSTDVRSAEAGALEEAGGAAYGRTLYATLEPQPELVVAAGIARVVIGAMHPDPGDGSGLEALESAGLEVVVADHEPSALLLEAFAKRLATGRPFVTLRLAVSRDGMIARRDGGPVSLMGDLATRWAAMQRALSDGVVIGANTAALDDPKLDLAPIGGLDERTYARIVLVGRRALPERLNLTGWVSGHPTYVVGCESPDLPAPPPNVEAISVAGRNGRPNLRAVLAALGARGIASVLVEGGATLTEAVIAAELADRFLLIECATTIGRDGLPATPLGGLDGRLRAAGLVETGRESLGGDLLRVFEPES